MLPQISTTQLVMHLPSSLCPLKQGLLGHNTALCCIMSCFEVIRASFYSMIAPRSPLAHIKARSICSFEALLIIKVYVWTGPTAGAGISNSEGLRLLFLDSLICASSSKSLQARWPNPSLTNLPVLFEAFELSKLCITLTAQVLHTVLFSIVGRVVGR